MQNCPFALREREMIICLIFSYSLPEELYDFSKDGEIVALLNISGF